MPTGWVGSDRHSHLPPGWSSTTVPRILKRDGYRCQHVRFDTERKCLRPAADVDHIVSDADGGSDDDSNLQSLCVYHHRQKTGREGGIASGKAKREQAQASKPVHPGLVDPLPYAPTRRRVGEEPAPF